MDFSLSSLVRYLWIASSDSLYNLRLKTVSNRTTLVSLIIARIYYILYSVYCWLHLSAQFSISLFQFCCTINCFHSCILYKYISIRLCTLQLSWLRVLRLCIIILLYLLYLLLLMFLSSSHFIKQWNGCSIKRRFRYHYPLNTS